MSVGEDAIVDGRLPEGAASPTLPGNPQDLTDRARFCVEAASSFNTRISKNSISTAQRATFRSLGHVLLIARQPS